MAEIIDLIGSLYLFVLVFNLAIVYFAWENRDQPSALGFVIAATGGGAWSTFLGLSYIVNDPFLTRWIYLSLFWSVIIASGGVLILGYEYYEAE
ncbi:MAG: hypothetical protein SXQ77_02795, partial [Halobacteria archaeon]|nr:hypothetical protein [Halobacteria archaeon]